jgi:hypothetical protein
MTSNPSHELPSEPDAQVFRFPTGELISPDEVELLAIRAVEAHIIGTAPYKPYAEDLPPDVPLIKYAGLAREVRELTSHLPKPCLTSLFSRSLFVQPVHSNKDRAAHLRNQ